MKNIFKILMIALLICTCQVPALAQENDDINAVRMIDQAEILSDSEEKSISGQLDKISEKYEVELVVVTIESMSSAEISGSTMEELADNIYDTFGYGYGSDHDGALLLISEQDRKWHISTCGFGIKAFTDVALDYVGDKMTPSLKKDDYASAIEIFISESDDIIDMAKDGKPFSKRNLPFPWAKAIGGSFVAAFVIALIVFFVLKGQLNSVHMQRAASQYTKNGSMNITNSNEIFLYRKVDKTKKVESSGGSTTHTSSSGTKHGGGGGSF